MTRSLPAVPSLVQLKHQAKDLRAAARLRDPEALSALRRLHRFSGASDLEIASATLRLSEAQFALALAYGERSWADLKARVERQRAEHGSTPPRLSMPGAISGFEAARWGSAGRHCSTLATMALVSERSEDRTDYDYLMGASGAAFRVQMSLGQLCPSSSHAICGFNCAELALAAWGSQATWFDTSDGHEPERRAALAAVHESLTRGVPALHEYEESSLIVGLGDDGTPLLRPYAARTDGYQPMTQWPFKVAVASPKVEVADPRSVLRDSLRVAIQLFDTPQVNRYSCGRQAYEHWSALLRDDAAHAAAGERERFFARLGNAHTFAGLIDARSAAVNYLQGMASACDDAVAPTLLAAADEYADLERSCAEQRIELAPYPRELPPGSVWSAQQRHALADRLSEVATRDAAAVDTLRRALSQLDAMPTARE